MGSRQTAHSESHQTAELERHLSAELESYQTVLERHLSTELDNHQTAVPMLHQTAARVRRRQTAVRARHQTAVRVCHQSAVSVCHQTAVRDHETTVHVAHTAVLDLHKMAESVRHMVVDLPEYTWIGSVGGSSEDSFSITPKFLPYMTTSHMVDMSAHNSPFLQTNPEWNRTSLLHNNAIQLFCLATEVYHKHGVVHSDWATLRVCTMRFCLILLPLKNTPGLCRGAIS